MTLNKPLTGWSRVIAVGIGAFVIGILIASLGKLPYSGVSIVTHPAAYELPKIPGGTSLLMAMFHDVLLERYLRHGRAWYEKRNADSRAIIDQEKAKPAPPSMRLLESMDDLAVGLMNLPQFDQATAVMRDKLKLLPVMTVELPPAGMRYMTSPAQLAEIAAATKQSPEKRQQYTTRANLGTSLIHDALPKLMAGDLAARSQAEEGLKYIEEAIEINPAAHFGREVWQAIVVRHFLACLDHPELAGQFDVIGNDLAEMEGREYLPYGMRESLPAPAAFVDANATSVTRADYRNAIMHISPADAWTDLVIPGVMDSQARFQVPFDEPVLGLMGMWMFGGGPNPHFAMALADVALQVGQLEIAWDGFERALEMQDRLSPDAKVREKLVAYCLSEQAGIAKAESSADPDAWTKWTRQRHDSELAWGRQYQDDYHAWEAKQIAAGVPLDDPSFYAAFFKNRPSIASPVGHADEIETRIFDGTATALVIAGLCMMVAAVTTPRVPKS